MSISNPVAKIVAENFAAKYGEEGYNKLIMDFTSGTDVGEIAAYFKLTRTRIYKLRDQLGVVTEIFTPHISKL